MDTALRKHSAGDERVTPITLFAVPKPFRGHIGIIQRNAIRSWTLLDPRPEIILLGDEEGIAEAAAELGVRHVPELARNEFGTPLLNDVFEKAGRLASSDLLAYVNADIILLEDFPAAVRRVHRWRRRSLMIGKRRDVNIVEPWNFERSSWQADLRSRVFASSTQRSEWYLDYFVFPRDLYAEIPPLAIGRTAWDNWLVWQARQIKAAVVDTTPAVLAVHQNHDYSHHPGGEHGVWEGDEAKRNLQLAGGEKHCFNSDDATHRLTSGGSVLWKPWRPRRLKKEIDHLRLFFVQRGSQLWRWVGRRRAEWLKVGNSRG